MPDRIYNFSSGPAVLPLPVLERAQSEMVSLPGVGASIMELSHRSPTVTKLLEDAEANIRTLLQLPENYRVLFLQGGARFQFVMVPFNYLQGQEKPASYIITGKWGKGAAGDAKRYGRVDKAFDDEANGWQRVPNKAEMQVDPDSAYVHFTSNETIGGVQFRTEPEVGDLPLVCDASSDIFSRPIGIQKYGLIYAGAQKNAGPAGVTMVIVRDDMLGRLEGKDLPPMMNYLEHHKAGSRLNTPPVFAIYIVKLVTDWLLSDIGGLEKMNTINEEKAALLYNVIDQSQGFYQGVAAGDSRSLMNVTWRLADDSLAESFLNEAKQRNLTDLKGHRSVGGFRAGIYNAMPKEGVQALRDFMLEFQEKNGKVE